ncbi:hypothetical protein ACT3R5_02030 [Glutamicibacter sp. AOP5-A2-7]
MGCGIREQHPEPGLARFGARLGLLGAGAGSLRRRMLVPFAARAESGSSAPVEAGLNFVPFRPLASIQDA